MKNDNNRIKDELELKEELEHAVLHEYSYEDIADKLLNYTVNITYKRAVTKDGCINDTPDDGQDIWWVVYQDESKEFYADTFMFVTRLPKFAANPWENVPRDSYPADVFIFGLHNNFIDNIAPHVAVLLKKWGIEKIYYYGWNPAKNKYGRWDAAESVREILDTVNDPHAFNNYKKELFEKRGGIPTIDDLAYLKSLKRIARSDKK